MCAKSKSAVPTAKPRILIIDDEPAIRSTIKMILEADGYVIDATDNSADALQTITTQPIDVAVCDIKGLGDMDGLALLEKVKATAPPAATQFIMITGHGSSEVATEALKKGATDFFEKPLDMNRVLTSVRNAVEISKLAQENQKLKQQSAVNPNKYRIVGESQAIQHILEEIQQVAPANASVLILGPNGSGKELVARQLHENSPRKEKPFVEVNCAAIPSELIESELFGHVKGAFTGATDDKRGKFEASQQGTLFLDEIGDMSLSAQAKVLRALQERTVTPVGSNRDIQVDVRVIAATNKDLNEEIRQHRFREDLLHRLNVVVIRVPALRERKTDIPLLVNHFLDTICTDYGSSRPNITEGAIALLQTLDWTGNVRELRNVTERLIIFCKNVITEDDVRRYVIGRDTGGSSSIGDIYDQFTKWRDFKAYTEKNFLLRKLALNEQNISRTAEMLGMERSHLYEKMDQYGIRNAQSSD